MDVVEVVKELRKELERIDTLILALDSLQGSRRRGRPPKLLQELRSGAKPGTTATKRTVRKATKKKTTRKAKKKTGKKAKRKGRTKRS